MVIFESLKSSLKHIAGIGLSAGASLSILCVFLFLVHVVFQIEFHCTCSGEEKLHCWFYMILPIIIICLVTLWADKRFRRIYRLTCNNCRFEGCSISKGGNHFGCRFFLSVFKAVFSGLVWVISLLLEGEWFACCYNSLPSDERMIPCKGNDQLNFTEKMSLREQKNTSMLQGFYLICAMLVVIIGTTCRSGCKCCYSLCGFSNNYIHEFEDNLLEEVETIFAEKLKTISTGYITEKINSNPELNILTQMKKKAPPTSRDAPRTSEDAPGASEDAPGASEDAPGTSEDAPGASGGAPGTLVEKVKKIDWDKFYKFSYDLIRGFQADIKDESQTRENERRDTESQSRGGTGNPSGSNNDQGQLIERNSREQCHIISDNQC